jgi:hypothetical protein
MGHSREGEAMTQESFLLSGEERASGDDGARDRHARRHAGRVGEPEPSYIRQIKGGRQ